ncbi:hypothetical protein [Priestia megaterium]|uniref:hypothetical protein n=1 Tax=Priestia megaterium TaxID=1404 RepID=UPI00203D7BFB|nr:hypothetical protein [Priestia megaterium]MCM3095036.1 hypothetical protein [Priestia megaterium]
MGALRNLSIYRKLLIMVIISTISLIAVAVISYFHTSELPTAQNLCIMTACSLSGS